MTTTTQPLPLDQIDVTLIKQAIRNVPDFPKPGILFKDITTVLRDGELFRQVVDYFYHQVKDMDIQYVVGIESRGFILGCPLAYCLNAGFVPIRKTGKLPGMVEKHEYDLEYGSDIVEIHHDAIEKGANVVLIDDLLATGGTAGASTVLLDRLGVNLRAVLFMIELDYLNGREKLLPGDTRQNPLIHSMIHF